MRFCLPLLVVICAVSLPFASRAQTTYDSADASSKAEATAIPSEFRRTVELKGVSFEITAAATKGPGILKVSTRSLGPDTWAVDAVLESSQPRVPVDLTIACTVRNNGITGLQSYSGNVVRDVQNRALIPYWKYEFTSGPTLGEPILSFIGDDNGNRFSIGARDVLGRHLLTQELSDPLRSLKISVRTLADAKEAQSPQRASWFVSFATRDVFDVFADFARYTRDDYAFPALNVPEWTYDPIFCTWSAIRTYIDSAWLLRAAPLAHQLGFRSVIIDDGWFDYDETVAAWDKPARSMVYLGTWDSNPRKFPQLAANVRQMQQQGLRVILWCAPFRVGMRGPLWKRFEHAGRHRTLNDPTAASVYVDPRYSDVREFVRGVMHKLVESYGVDGLKVDMVDNVGMRLESHMDQSIAGVKAGPIYAELMSSTLRELQAKRPDLVVESRIGYANLAARTWTNAYRVADCPYNVNLNRMSAAILRRLYPDRAVYMDPIIWPEDESDANVGRTMISTILAVPQVSVDLEKIPVSHREIIRHWIGFYQQHRPTIMHGEFIPRFTADQLPEARFRSEREEIVGVYDNVAVVLPVTDCPVFLLNGSTRDWLDVSGSLGAREIVVVDATGRRGAPTKVAVGQTRIAVPVGGYVELKPVAK